MSGSRSPHGFEHMRVFRLGVDLVEAVDSLDRALARRKPALNHQLQDAAVSVLANIGEGATELSRADKRRFYRYALRSTGECAALIHAAERIEALPDDAIDGVLALLLRIRTNLFRLIGPSP
jgi:four helix bundle protein